MKKIIDFIKYRYISFSLSLIVIVVGFIFGLNGGFRFDIDFRGGTTIQTELKTEFVNSDIENIVKGVIGSNPLVQKLTGGDNAVTITTNIITEEQTEQIINELKVKYPEMEEPSTRNVQPAFGKELLNSALLAVIVSVAVLLLYIGIRFRALGFAAAITAIIALIHDVLVITAIYGIFNLPINSAFIAVVLTIVGYSINDTIIVYDRIRENKKNVAISKDMKTVINTSINQTLKRTIYTSLTTVVAILIVYIFAVLNNQQVLKEFSLPLMIGVITGTYSSVFIASSLWFVFDNIKNKFKKDKTKKKK